MVEMLLLEKEEEEEEECRVVESEIHQKRRTVFFNGKSISTSHEKYVIRSRNSV